LPHRLETASKLRIFLFTAQVFLTEPSDQTVPRDSTAAISFECEANVNSGVYKWRKDGSPLEISGRCKLSFDRVQCYAA